MWWFYRSRCQRYGFWRFFWDCVLTFLTCGLWALYILFKALRRMGG